VSLEYFRQFPSDGLYVMQGRLSPPTDGKFQSFPCWTWQDEVERVRPAGLRGIEWIFDIHGVGVNPIETSEGRMFLSEALVLRGVTVRSVCADYFMDKPFHKGGTHDRADSMNKLSDLLKACSEMGVQRVVLPFVDASRMETSQQMAEAVSCISRVIPTAEDNDVELHIESDLPPNEFVSFLNELRSDFVKVNYDAGNSASLGYKPYEEFSMYGDRIGSFHVKDRKLNGGTVPLGHGDTDFRSLRACLQDIRYSGDFVLQVARGVDGDEVRWLKRNATAVVEWIRGEVESPLLES
jgi:L-ribulose-5-phosphate 3-epimerase